MKTYGLLLVGGRSARMGQDKATMLHPDGRTLWQRGVDLLEECCDRVHLSLREDQESRPFAVASHPPILLRDQSNTGDGPMAGLMSAFQHAPDVRWLVMSCDLPRADARTLRHLIDSHREEEAFLAYRSEFDGLPEPLCALYAPQAYAFLQAALDKKFCCPRKVLIHHQCRLLDPVVARALENTNTPQEWEHALL
ncbi:MAG: molybdenum cofactor guanylyltransferase [Verrucomicrobia bacterium]|nr:MAG: molybdenum cofactor guanylyltransferase [Verrucomicrobiota bacterium]